ncbi:hypothetical protein KZA77_007065 [Streptococcus constellatus]|uniref:hypothetical protein n=1 Tax=Streptococcus TaxID=1301 RepID=UPI000450BAB3|nr:MULTISPECIES: hypothetical protein [Streptococcus]EUB22060.1 hypothetical protein HMPREF1514_0073 [Streptococcus sp. AS20]MBW3452349.1 hypothetical protein [Streptococcus constellatus]
MKFIKRQILDEREEQLVNKAGTEAFSLLMISNFIFYIGSVFVHSGEIYAQLFLVNHAMYQNNPLHAKFLLAIPITFLLYLPIILVFNLLLEVVGKWQKRRFEKYLSELEDEA